MLWQTVIHLTFVVSAVALAAIDRFLSPRTPAASEAAHSGRDDREPAGSGSDGTSPAGTQPRW
jgi:hypothetical protein